MFGISICSVIDLLQFNIFLDINVNSQAIFIDYNVVFIYETYTV